MPGYVVTVKVKSLKPSKRLKSIRNGWKIKATEAEKATHDPNAKNGYVSGSHFKCC